YDAHLQADIEQAPLTRDTLVKHDVELADAERWGNLVLDHLDFDPAAHRLGADFDSINAANIKANRGVELESPATWLRFGVAKHDANLLTQLIGEDNGSLGVVDGPCQLAQRLAHKARLQTDVRIAHLALDLGTRHKRSHRVNNDSIQGAAAYQHLHDLQRLLASIGL